MLISEIFCFTIMPIDEAAHSKNTWLLGAVVLAAKVGQVKSSICKQINGLKGIQKMLYS